ncbi:hypothetical protein LTR64_001314 [Lithohypha guttulata]|uniref:uncharacterized protein n=1 Tax=Lithohypha guttulata TaxID=1690604 RepID=UPI002DDE0076|nr:hypothetical protein LTR51_003508 [Lithohypha guttulata]
MQSLTNIAPCFGIELPGHGRSTFAPKDYQAYTIEANAALWKAAIEEICRLKGHKSVVLIGHSMGCSISVLLASSTSSAVPLSVPVSAVVSICPRARPFSDHDLKTASRLCKLPDPIINILRWFDRRGGVNSTSVNRVIGDMKEPDLRRMQLQWNRQYRTPVLKRITSGLLPQSTLPQGGYPSAEVWKGLRIPLFLIAGESDRVTPTQEVDTIVRYVTEQSFEQWKVKQQVDQNDPNLASTNGLVPLTIRYSPNEDGRKQSVIQVITLPSPAAHALLYAHTTYRLVSALVESFLANHVSSKLDFSYQLRLLTTAGKWDVKNYLKWRSVLPVSDPINTDDRHGGFPNGTFRALKTMREQDDEHNPTIFLQKWADKIYAVIDISHDVPVYNSKVLDSGGVEYHKFPTVSKIPPTPLEVQDFCSLVDTLIAEKNAKEAAHEAKRSIAVHCHYGYNRTGFFIASYLISRCDYTVQQAIDEFARAKPPGIRHEHFKDTLWLRFASGSIQQHTRVSIIAKRSETITGKHNASSTIPEQDEDIGNITEGDFN